MTYAGITGPEKIALHALLIHIKYTFVQLVEIFIITYFKYSVMGHFDPLN